MNSMKPMVGMVACLAASVALLLLANSVERQFEESRPWVSAFCGVVFGGILFFCVSELLKRCVPRRAIPKAEIRLKEWLFGAGFGLIVFLISVTLLLLQMRPSGAEFPELAALGRHLLNQIRPAVIEEVGFRYGLVTMGVLAYGRIWGVIAGSIPFGILHLLNFVSGQPIYRDYILGTTLAGLFLSLVYLRFGLAAAVATHYVWNVCAATSAKMFAFTQEKLEGSPGTLIVLMIASLVLYRLLPGESKVQNMRP